MSQQRKWTKEEIKILKKTVYLIAKETATMLNRSVRSIYSKSFSLGIKRTNRKEKISNNKNPMWKGKDVSYRALHSWVRTKKKKPKLCESCKKVKPYDLANISGEYKRDINDFKWVCRGCHMEEDGRINNLRQYQI